MLIFYLNNKFLNELFTLNILFIACALLIIFLTKKLFTHLDLSATYLQFTYEKKNILFSILVKMALKDHDYVILANHEEVGVPNLNLFLQDHTYVQHPAIQILLQHKKQEQKQQARTYKTIPGVRLNSKFYVDNFGYKYYQKKLRVNRITLICERQKNPSRPVCYGSASISRNEMDNQILIHPEAGYIPPDIIESKKDENIKTPTITSEHARSCRNVERSAECKLQLFVNGGTVGIIFANTSAIEKYRKQLATVEIVGIDGTYKMLPQMLIDLQSFLTSQILYKSVVINFVWAFLMVFVLLGSETEETYCALFAVIYNTLPLNYDGICFVTNYERALMNAVQQIFPNWFHYTQSVVRYSHRKVNGVLNLVKRHNVAARIFRMMLALLHLPAERGHPGLGLENGLHTIVITHLRLTIF
ncbi:hypothetical protein AGLY_008633 [Aphis glycines]|uniref:MULE transposase domain-containing protein n=1 Tax=Aphis glycines TaxID=307491 RepID=A0A6G0TMU4_APHGL|nr:hypothetical protein AGLY_008633 [Aphis glycines]